MANNCYPFENTPLPYAYDALEPCIDQRTMHLHHDKHLGAYISKLNDALKDCPRLQKMTLGQLLCQCESLPQNLRAPVHNNAGGVYNHRFFFAGMAPPKGQMPQGHLKQCLESSFGSIDNFKKQFSAAAAGVFGSGYAWLVFCRGNLQITTTANQNTPTAEGLCPILTIDVWEHAYYLKHQNLRADYIADWWKVVNWKKAEENLQCCRSGK